MRRVILFLALLAPAGVVLAQGALDRGAGKALFERIWVPAPASTDATDGLGPLFAERSCVTCHGGPGGGAAIAFNPDGLVARGLTVHLGDAKGAPDPVYGTDFQARAIPGMAPEGSIEVTAKDRAAPLEVAIRPERGPFAPGTHISVRLSPPIVTRARIERVDEAAILALADPDDANHDGISGRASMITTPDGPKLGRFGWKSTQVDLDHQIAHAFAIDIGLSSSLDPLPYGDCTSAEKDCLSAPNGRSPNFDGEEISSEIVRLVAEYVRGLEPPEGNPPGPADLKLFGDLGCSACHVPDLPAKGGGTVTLYSDLLLHDLGPGLDDGVGAENTASSEWRTTPLAGLSWAIGSTRRYLHDGRAPDLDAAIRAHGGEAAAALHNYVVASPEDRARLIAFLEHL